MGDHSQDAASAAESAGLGRGEASVTVGGILEGSTTGGADDVFFKGSAVTRGSHFPDCKSGRLEMNPRRPVHASSGRMVLRDVNGFASFLACTS